MPMYEHVFLARQDLSQAQVDALAQTATEIVEQNEGKVCAILPTRFRRTARRTSFC